MTKLTREILGIGARKYFVLNGLVSTNEEINSFLTSVVHNIGPRFPGRVKPFITEMVEHGLVVVKKKRESIFRNDNDLFITACCELGIRIYEQHLVAGLTQSTHSQQGTLWEPWSLPVDEFIAMHSNHRFIPCECPAISKNAAEGIFAAMNLSANVFTRLYQIEQKPKNSFAA